jgi:transposase
VRNAGPAAITALLAQGRGKKRRVQKQAAEVFQAAVESVGLKAVSNADRARLTMYLDEIKRSDARRQLLEQEMTKLLKEIPLAQYILSLPGMGKVGCAVFLGELGNPKHFGNPRQIIKYAGYDPKENDSGLQVGRKIISKKGRWLLRKCLYYMVLRLVHRSPFFKAYYEHKKKGVDHPLAKTEALCAVVLKLIRVLFALMRDKRMFTEEMPGCEQAA